MESLQFIYQCTLVHRLTPSSPEAEPFNWQSLFRKSIQLVPLIVTKLREDRSDRYKVESLQFMPMRSDAQRGSSEPVDQETLF